MASSAYDALRTFLDERQAQYEVFEHATSATPDQQLTAIGLTPERAMKSLLYESVNGYALAVIPLAARISSGRLKRALGARDAKLASPDEVRRIMSCNPGECHAIGHLAGVRTIADMGLALAPQELIGMGGGDPEHTIAMRYAEYLRLATPEVASIQSERG